MAGTTDEIRIPIFDGKDYTRWKYKLLLHLEVRECKTVITDQRPTETSEADWNKLDAKARDYIVNLVSNDIFDVIINEPNAKAIILKLDSIYQSQSTANKVQIRKRLIELKLAENEDPNPFFLNFEKLVNELKNSGVTFNEEEKLATLLSALPNSYSHLIDIIDSIATDKFEYLKNRIISNYGNRSKEEASNEFSDRLSSFHLSRRGNFHSNKHRSRSRNHHSSMRNNYHRSKSYRSYRHSNSKSPSRHHNKNNQRCSQGCDNFRHRNSSPESDDDHRSSRRYKSNQTNFSSKRNGYSNNSSSNRSHSNYSKGHKDQSYSNKESYNKRSFSVNRNDENSCSSSNLTISSENEINLDDPNLSNSKYYANVTCRINPSNFETNFSCRNSSVSQPNSEIIEWLLDSGCSDHIVNSDKYFAKSEVLNDPIKIGLGDGSPLIANLKGDINVKYQVGDEWFSVTIYDVFYVPDMKSNLLSVSRITDKGNHLKFNNNQGILYSSEGEIFGVAERHKNLYRLLSRIQGTKGILANNLEKQTVSVKEEWHKKTGHMSFPNLNKLIISKCALGLPEKLNEEQLQCEICLESKMANLPFKNIRWQAKRPGEIIHSDVCGPFKQTGYKGEKYFCTFVDDYSKFSIVQPIKSKSEVFASFKESSSFFLNRTGNTIKELRCDNGKEYINNQFEDLARKWGFQIKPCPRYRHELNGTAERLNRTILDRTRCLFNESNLPKSYWPLVVRTVNFLKNRTLINLTENKTPFEIIYERKPDLSFLKIYGSDCYVRVPEEIRSSKFAPKAEKGKLVGYEDNCYVILVNGKIVKSRDVKFLDQNTKSIQSQISNLKSRQCYDEESKNQKFVRFSLEPESETSDAETETEIGQHSTPTSQNSPTDISTTSSSDFRTPSPSLPIHRIANPSDHETTQNYKARLRDRKTLKLPRKLADHEIFTNFVDINVPFNYEEALRCDNSENWINAMEEELKAHRENNTWSIVKEPKSQNIIDVKWLYRMKDSNKFKARLVARGFQQEFHQNEEIYSPVAKLTSIKMLLSLSAVQNLSIHQMDVQTAFLNGEINEDVFIKAPKCLNVKEGYCLKLNKALYGLRESPRSWYNCFDRFMNFLNFHRSNFDCCLYFKDLNSIPVYVLIFVDDILFFSKDKNKINSLKKQLKERFKMKDFGQINKYLGIQAVKEQDNSIKLNQTDYICSVAEKFNVIHSKLYDTPMEQNLKLLPAATVKDETLYRSLIGALLFIAMNTRPDVAFAVNYLSRFQNSCDETHFKYALRVLKYLLKTSDLNLIYNANTSPNQDILSCFVDADWAGDPVDRKSTTGYVIKLYGNPILWKSRKQKSVTKSSTEAEYLALSDATSELKFLSSLLSEINIVLKQPIPIYEDNLGAVVIANKGNFSKNSKHIEVHNHFVNESVNNGLINVIKISSDENEADILTKSLGKQNFSKFRKSFNLIEH